MPVTKLAQNPLLDALTAYFQSLTEPKLNDSVPLAQVKGFVGETGKNMIPSPQDQIMQAAMPMVTLYPNVEARQAMTDAFRSGMKRAGPAYEVAANEFA